MGNIAPAMAALCQALEISYVRPEENNKRTLETGSAFSPEEICLPFKLILGNLIDGVGRGADTILMTGSCGPCRFGEYCELQMKLLRQMGYDKTDFIVADLSPEIGFPEFARRLGRIAEASSVSRPKKLRALKAAYDVLRLSDEVDRLARDRAGYEAEHGECRRLLNDCKSNLLICQTPGEALRLLTRCKRELASVPVDNTKKPLRIAIIGEIFTIIDPFSNLYIEDKLMAYGASTTRMLTPSWWLKNMALKPLGLYARRVYKASERYLPVPVGGHGKECVGEAVLAHRDGLDGAIQVYPMGCMPEVVAKSVLPTIRTDTGFPVLTLVVDEVTGEAGFVTRVEAFLDMLESRREKIG
jgi:predicted nucleotide-binding protein (sugar kinase/HSP70/actin superfamily)